MQRDDESLKKYWEKDDVVVRGQAETSFEVKRWEFCTASFKHPYVNGGKPLKQVYGSRAAEKSNNGVSTRIDHGRSHGNKEND